jgi:amino acid adenylation domain-containing protein/non-ribosomal peptide synthase protein (TIGR01720 family)
MVFNQRAKQKVLVGSVKTNIGHLEGAAGIASIIKVILALQHENISPSLHFHTPSVHIPWKELPIEVCAKLTQWKKSEKPRVAGVSSFGFSGTNAHIIIQESPESESESKSPKSDTYLLPLSAKDGTVLRDMADRYRKCLSECSDIDLKNFCYTAAVGRTHFKHRLAVTGKNKDDLIKRLSEVFHIVTPDNAGIVFLFTGQGAQYPGMAKKLYDNEPVFAKALNHCDETLKEHGVSLINLLYGAESSVDIVNQTANTQPLLFAIEYALSELWRSWGIKPATVIGHSIGEYAAACIAGVFSLEDGLKLAAIRGKLLQSLPKGGVMAAVLENVQKVLEIIGNRNISVAAVNSPKNVVISGKESDITEALAKLSKQGIRHTLLQVSHAFHSHLTEPILEQFQKIISGVRLSEPVLPLISNLTGKQVQASEITQPEYWCRHLRQTVLFYDGLKTLENQGYEIFLEIGPHAVLSGLGKQCFTQKGIWLPSMIRGEDDIRQMMKAAAQLYINGSPIDWSGVYASSPGKKIILPTYPFQRKRYWKSPVRDINLKNNEATMQNTVNPQRAAGSGRKNNIVSELIRLIRSIAGIESPDIHLNLFKMGLSSIMLTRLKQSVENDFSIEIQMSQFYEDTDTINKLAGFIAMQSAECKVQNEDTLNIELPASNSDIAPVQAGIESIMREQIQAMSKLMTQQLEVLKGRPITDTTPTPALPKTVSSASPIVAPHKEEESRHERADFRSMKLVKDELTPQQEKFIRDFCVRYSQRTRKSRELIEKHRPVFSDWINSLGFRMSLKEIMYPIASHRSQGARLWDIDGNEYIDMAIGYGVNYFGNNAPFVVEAVEKQLKDGFHLGPQFDLTSDVAELICELTGIDRVTFCNTGTEAVMTALRIARTVTGRDKIVIFQGSYHGTYDGILAIPTARGSFPASPGTPSKMVEDVYVLKYGDPESLEFIKAHGRELAAILTEPVQSRNPTLQPREFLKQLREITFENKIALIFDEIITGFRIHQGGAQAFYNIQADMVTYGKVIGGGMPVGVIGGKSRFMDAIDGGMWKYGDSSFPAKGVTFFGGTFCKHPLAMAASLAVLKHLKAEGHALQERVNQLTSYFANTVNVYFETASVPLRVRHCASFFKFDSFGDYDIALQPISTDLMFYLLMEKGVYTWERRICFFSTAHTREDIDTIIRAIRESVEEIRSNGFPFSVQNRTTDYNDKMQPLITQNILNSAPFSEISGSTLNCSSEQRRLYILSQLEGGELPYHLPGGTFIEGKPDIDRLNRAFTEIIRRHESLRTGFEVSGDDMLQRVHESVDFAITVKEGRESDIEKIAQEFIQPFDLSKPPLMRVSLIRLSENRCLLLMDVHHIVADGLSANIIVQEFLELYQGHSLPPVSAQYRGYVRWQESYLRSERVKKQEAFWLAKFSDEIPVLNLPTDFPRPVRQQFDGDHVWFSSDAETAKSLAFLAKNTGSSMFMLTLAAYYVLLHKLSNQEDIVAGIASGGRGQKEFEHAVGMFVNTLPIRQKLSATLSFSEFLNLMKKDLLNIYDHQEYPFELLVRKLKLSGNMSRNLLSDVMFNFENADDRTFSIEGLRFSPYDFKPKAALTDLLLEIIETSGSLNMRLEYCTKLFKRETIERWAVYYRNILKAIITEPNKPLSDIDILPEHEKRQVIFGFNDTRASYPKGKTISELFEEQVRKTPDAVALIFENETVSYRQLNERANQVAHHLRKRYGIKPDDIVGMITELTPLMFYVILGISKAGGAYLPINTAYPQERMEYMLTDSRCRVVLTDTRHKSAVSVSGLEIIDISEPMEESIGNPAPAAQSHHLAYVIYTSGSTGLPKGCMITHENVVRLMMNSKFPYNFNASDVWTMAHSYAFDFSVWEMYGAFLYGGKLVVPDFESIRDVSRFLALVKKHRVTVLNQTPPAFYNFIKAELESEEKALDQHLRWVIFGGDRLEPAHLKEWFQQYSPDAIQLVNMYGITETTVHVSFYRLGYEDMDAPEVSPIGLPIPETTIYVLDKHKKPVPIGVSGEMYVGGTGVCRGYLNRPELTAEKFVENPFVKGEKLYKSGDLARRLSNGNLQYLGRNDDQVQLRGYRVELGEVEKKILSHPGIEKSVVMAKTAQDGHSELVAYMVNHEESLSVSDLRSYLSKKLPDYMIPAYFVALKNFPLTSNGKIDRRALPNPLETDAVMQLGTEYAAPGNEIEATMTEIWEAVLGRKNIGIHDDFFALGGDSIKAIQVVSRLNAAKLKSEVRLIFQYPTIAELSRNVLASGRRSEQSIVTGIVPLTAIQSWFFKKHGKHKDHFAQAVLLKSSERLNETALRKAFEAILIHHDALRMRYRVEGDTVIQENFESATCNVQCAKSENEFRQYGSAIAESLRIDGNSLMKAILFENRLLIVIHHLVTDGVSWRILIEDIETAYRQAVSGKPIVLPEKTDSFKRWAEKIDAYRNSQALMNETQYWQSLESANVRPISRDNEAEIHRQKDSELLTISLSEKETEVLLTRVNKIYHTEINDILLTALARAMKRWHGESKMLISLEGHGREALFEDAGISRTVGWFTAIYPVLLELPDSEDIGYQISFVKNSLRKIPNKGIGYGILKYLANLPDGRDSEGDVPQILFNYLGSFEHRGGLFESAEEFTQNTVHPEFEKDHDLEIEGMISGGKLRFSIAFTPKQYRRDRIEELLNIYADELKAVITHCAEKQSEVLTKAGFGDNFADVYPLSPTQEGILFHYLYQQSSTAYIEQFSFQIQGKFNIEVFKESWNELVRRYDILRTAFVHKHTERPMQIVLKKREIGFDVENISSLKKEEQDSRIRNFKVQDRNKGFELSRDALMRIKVFETGQNNYEVIWTHHHILLDGWCLGILIRELFETYNALKEKKKLVFVPAVPYSKYILWLESRDKEAAKRYWKAYLAGYEHPVSLSKNEHPGGPAKIEILTLEVQESVAALLEKLAAEQRVTLNTIFKSIWGILLGVYNNTSDVVFGTTVSGRAADFPGIEQMVGLFLNTVPVRITSENHQRFADLIRNTQQQYLESEPFHFVSLGDIQLLTPFKRNLLDHVMVFENYPLSQELGNIAKNFELGFSIGEIEEFEHTGYDLSIEIYPGKMITVEFNYDISKYSETQMTKIRDDLSRLLNAVAKTPEITIGDLRNLLISQEEKSEQDRFVSSVMQISEEF